MTPKPLKVYVSAASRGLAFEVARRLARDGARLALSSRREDHLASAREQILLEFPSVSVLTIPADLAKVQDQENVLDTLEHQDFMPDVFVCSNGQPPSSSLETITREQWRNDIEMILSQAVFATQRFAPAMANRHYGRFIFISSILAKYPGLMAPDYFLSCLARSALFSLAKVIQGEYAADGVAAFAVALGYVDTPLLRNMALGQPFDADAPGTPTGTIEPWRERYDEWAASIPARRIASAAELAEVVAFLVSPAADYLNGTVLSFAGGLDRGIL